MIIGFNLMYHFYLSRLKQNFNRGFKLLHVFWNTLYMIEITPITLKINLNVARGFAAQKSLRENIPWFFVYSQFNIFSV